MTSRRALYLDVEAGNLALGLNWVRSAGSAWALRGRLKAWSPHHC